MHLGKSHQQPPKDLCLFDEPFSVATHLFFPYCELFFRSGGPIREKGGFFWALEKDLLVDKKGFVNFMRKLKLCQGADVSMLVAYMTDSNLSFGNT